jgi:hypothetical protein
MNQTRSCFPPPRHHASLRADGKLLQMGLTAQSISRHIWPVPRTTRETWNPLSRLSKEPTRNYMTRANLCRLSWEIFVLILIVKLLMVTRRSIRILDSQQLRQQVRFSSFLSYCFRVHFTMPYRHPCHSPLAFRFLAIATLMSSHVNGLPSPAYISA